MGEFLEWEVSKTLKVRKFICNDCDSLSLIENRKGLNENMYCCPNCTEPMEYLGDFIIEKFGIGR